MKLSEFRESQEKGFNAATLIHHNTNTGSVYVLIDRTEPELRIEVKRYVFDGEQWSVGFLYVGNDYVCAMDKFQGALNSCIVDPLEGLKFTCPECGGHHLECCEDGFYVSRVTCIQEDGNHEYGDVHASGDVIRWQCEGCGFVIEEPNGGDIVSNEDAGEWVKENCK